MSDYSLNEVASRAKLAARGAGYSWGMAEEVSRVIYWLVSRGLPGAEMLAHLLQALDGNTPHGNTPNDGALDNTTLVKKQLPDTITQTPECQHVKSRSDWLCPIAAACALADTLPTLQPHMQFRFYDVKSPVLMIPVLADLAIRGKCELQIVSNAGQAITDGCTMRYSSAALFHSQHLSVFECKLASDANQVSSMLESVERSQRVTVSSDTWKALDSYAQKTYAPATDASRALGAGASLSDND